MAHLAIKGHPTRGKEVIEILEMLGGNNKYHINVTECHLLYTIRESDNVIIGTYPNSSISQIYTIEEFLEKFPYKVGDKVYNIIHNENQTITNMFWDVHENEIIYQTINNEYVYVNYLQPNKEETMEEKGTLVQIDLTRELCVADEVEVILGDYEFVLKDGKTYFVKKKPQYPKTYEECCGISDIYPIYNKPNLCICEWHPETREMHEHYSKLANLSQKDIAFMILRICRDAYWKIAGEQMGLGKSWEPDFGNDLLKYYISFHNNKIDKGVINYSNKILAFPTEEMRDTFYENFKDLIEQCKELL